MNTRVRIFEEAPGDWQAWLDTDAQNFDGLCIGVGTTRDAAVADAVRELEEVVCELQQEPGQ